MDTTIKIKKIIRRGKRRVSLYEGQTVDSASIGDMAFLLLIFFIVTSSFLLRQGIFFSLPSKSAGAVKIDEQQLVEVYPENEGFLYKGTLMPDDAFKALLRKRKEEKGDTVLIIVMKKHVRYQRLVDTLGLAKALGIGRVSLKNEEGGR